MTTAEPAPATTSTSVQFTMGATGLTSLTWNGQEFLFPGGNTPSVVNAFSVDAAGNTKGLKTSPNSTVTDGQAGTVTQTFDWGSILTQYQALEDKLAINVTIQNAGPGTIYRYWIYPLAFTFPATPVILNNTATFNVDGPSSIYWDYVNGVVDLVNEDVVQPLAIGFWQAESPANKKWFLIVYVDPGQNLNPNWPAIIRPIDPGTSDTLTMSLRFGGPGAYEDQLAGDIYALYRNTFPRVLMQSAPRKPIARLSFCGRFRPGFPTNPRGWFNSSGVDVTTAQGVANFHKGLLSSADSCIAEMTRVGAYGGILWDLDGQQSDLSYLGVPEMAEIMAPELIGILDDFIGKFQAAGFPIGFTLRPQEFNVEIGVINVSGTKVTWVRGAQFQSSWAGDINGGALAFGVNNYTIASVESPTSLTLFNDTGTANQVPYFYATLTNTDPYTVMQKKIQYTYVRWGATLFYVDSTLDYQGNITPAEIFGRLREEYPNVYIFPEWKSTRHYAYTYPWTDAANGYIFPSKSTMLTYPLGGGLIRVPSDEQIASVQQQLAEAVAAGSVLLFDGWYPHSGNDVVKEIYARVNSRRI